VVPDRVGHGPVGEDGIVLLEELSRGAGGRDDHGGDGAQAERHDRAVDLGEASEGAVRLVTQEVEASD
jgi:hypothetical protein